jgi:hypothetical protein
MSDFDWDDDEETTEPEANQETPLIKKLRKQLKDLAKERDTLKTEKTTWEAEKRGASLKSVLSSKGVSEKALPKVAKLLEKFDIEATDDAVGSWLEEYADVFNIQRESNTDTAETNSDSTEQPNPAGLTQEQIRQLRQMDSVTQGGKDPTDLVNKLKAATTREELDAIVMGSRLST